MQCSQCGKANDGHYVFCLGCGARLPQQPVEPGAGAAAMGPQGQPCGRCRGSRTVQGGVGPQLGVRVAKVAGGYQDLPIASAWVCIDCGHVSLQLPEDARQYLALIAGR